MLLLALAILTAAGSLVLRLVLPRSSDTQATAARTTPPAPLPGTVAEQSAVASHGPSAPGAAAVALTNGAHPVRRKAPVVPPPPAYEPGTHDDDVGPIPDVPGAKPGIAVFPPPGTDPPKTGIVVPDDFELPEGYIRHFQTTDDGQQLPPILMFHPDYDWVDANGVAVKVPADHVVPPELAPHGLAVKMLDVPKTTVPRLQNPDGTPFELPAH